MLSLLAAMLLPGCSLISTTFATAPGLTVQSFEKEYDQVRHHRADPNSLAAQVQSWFGGDISKGDRPKSDQTTVVWALKALSQPTVVSEDSNFTQKLEPLGKSGIFVGVSHLKSGDGFRYHYRLAPGDQPGGLVEVWNDPPESTLQSGVTAGTLTQMPDWHSHVFEGTTRQWYLYTPSGLQAGDSVAVMIFQDGQWMKNYVPIVLDNLIAKGDIPKMVALFITPGTYGDGRSDRSFEYDTLSDQYSRFLLQEMLPEAQKALDSRNVTLRQNPESRAVAGLSSGGICAFTAAWEHPEAFGKVMSWIGSFTNIAHGPSLDAGGHNYPALIRLTKKKPIRVFLQDGENDLDNQFGNWPLANQTMAKALDYAGYDYRFAFGHGTHSDIMGRAILPETLRWLWRQP